MATLQERNGSFRVLFVDRGKRHTFTLGKVSEEEGQAKSAQVDYLLLRLTQKLIELPPGLDIAWCHTIIAKHEIGLPILNRSRKL